MKRLITCGLAALAAVPLSAAVPTQFVSCDGYGAPNEHGDGITKEATGFLGIFRPEPGRGDTRLVGTVFSRAGIAACDAALDDTRLAPAYWMRRVSLIRARAIHRLAMGDDAGALADLDAASTIAREHPDPLFDRSLGLGIRLFRAFALAELGKKQEAAADLDAIADARPFAGGLQRSTGLIRLMATGDWTRFRADLLRTSRTNPEQLLPLFYVDLQEGKFADAIAIRSQILFALPRASAGFQVMGDVTQVEAELFAEEVGLDSFTSLALLALGRAEESAKLLAHTQQRVIDAGKPRDNIIDGHSPAEAKRLEAALFQRVPQLQQLLDEAKTIAGLFNRARANDVDAITAAMKEGRFPADSFGIGILESIPATSDADRAEIREVAAMIREKAAAARKFPELKLEDIYAALPEAETPSRLPEYKSGKKLFGDGKDGFLVKPLVIADRYLITFGGSSGSAAVVEEMALLRAAEMAREVGRKGFVVLSRRTYARESSTTYYGVPVNRRQEGYSAELMVALVDPVHLPDDLKDAGPRVMDAENVLAALSPVYLGSNGARSGR